MACIFYCVKEKLNKRMYPWLNTHIHTVILLYIPFSPHTHPPAWCEPSDSHVDFFINKDLFYRLTEGFTVIFTHFFSFGALMFTFRDEENKA